MLRHGAPDFPDNGQKPASAARLMAKTWQSCVIAPGDSIPRSSRFLGWGLLN